MSGVACGNCGRALDETPDNDPAQRVACPTCGSLSRHISVELEGSLTLHGSIGVNLKRGGKGKAVLKLKSGDDFTVSTGRWAKLDRIVDREADRYYELVVDTETGEVLRYVDEPLSAHQGRGSAKPRLEPQAD